MGGLPFSLVLPTGRPLILAKKMRGDDPQDMADVDFLIRHDRVTADALEAALNAAVLPDLVELRDAFAVAKPRVRELVRLAGF